MSVKRGDVVIVRFPFASGAGAKMRPALVVQNDLNNSRMTNVILVAITTTTHRNQQPTQLFVDVTTPGGRQSGLLKDSVVSCENIATVEQSLVTRTIGSLPPGVMSQIEDCLKASLALS